MTYTHQKTNLIKIWFIKQIYELYILFFSIIHYNWRKMLNLAHDYKEQTII